MNVSRGRRLVLIGLSVIVLAVIFNQQILYALGSMLVDAGPPHKADIIIVLGGDSDGGRIMKAAELMREGYAPRVLVSGVADIYGRTESDLAIDFAVSKGAPRERFVPLYESNLSTTDEVSNDLREALARGAHSILVVTSEYHSRRSSRIFRRESSGMGVQVFMVASDTPAWGHGKWWHSREGQKLWLVEFEKTIADFLRI